MKNAFGKEYIPIHDDKNLHIQWWLNRGIPMGDSSNPLFEIYINAVRDTSGKYDGFMMIDKRSRKTIRIRTIAEAEAALIGT